MADMSKHSAETQDYKSIAAAKRADLESRIPQEWRFETPITCTDDISNMTKHALNYLTTREADITENYTAGQLVERIARRDYSALEVAKAFGRRAVIAHQLTNCLSEILLSKAFEQAAELDAHLADTGTTVGSLHGLPVSLKDQFRVEGTETSMGFLGLLGNKETKESESHVVKALKEAGAVIFVKTNVPSGMMAVETNNNIVGYTSNAYNRNLSSGGSSGGEASLIASRGSLIGLGTDIGENFHIKVLEFPYNVSIDPFARRRQWSLRSQAFRRQTFLQESGQHSMWTPASEITLPSQPRMLILVNNQMEGQNIVPSVIGPIGHSPSDLGLMMKTLLSSKPWISDPNVISLPWRPDVTEEVSSQAADRKLKFGVMRWDGIVMPHPPIKRVLEETVIKLRSTGFEVVEWDPPSHSEAFDILFKVFTADSGQSIHSLLSLASEPPVPELALSYSTSASAALSALGLPMTINAYWDLQKKSTVFRERYFEYWNTTTASITATAGSNTTGVDAVIMPVAPSASVEKGEGKYFGYTGVGNVLDASVITVPAGTVDKGRDGKMERDMKGVGDMDRVIWESYDPEVFDGMPVGLQVMCRRLEEEKVLAIATELQRPGKLSNQTIIPLSNTPSLSLTMDTLPPIIQEALTFEKSNWVNGSVHDDVFYKLQPDSPTSPPGTPLKVEEDTDTAKYLLPPATAMSRFIYQSEDFQRSSVPAPQRVSGLVPQKRAMMDTPSLFGHKGPVATPLILKADGYVVVAPDYAGLGVSEAPSRQPVIHQYLAGPSHANDIVYAVHAAQRIFSDLSKDFVVIGHSQGGGATWTTAQRQSIKPVPGLLGVIAVSPVTTLMNQPEPLVSLIAAAICPGLASVNENVPLFDVVTEEGQQKLKTAETVGAGVAAGIPLLTGDSILKEHWMENKHFQSYHQVISNGGRKIGALLLAVDKTAKLFPSSHIEFFPLPGVSHVPALQTSQRLWME
ncbi:MAG: hypothetical protein Q9183_000771 [Haloplaca sp. 2 TL-2023]